MSASTCEPRHENTIRRVAGTLVLIATLGAWLHDPAWLFVAAFVGANLFQSSFTGFCPLENILEAASRRQGAKA